MKYLLLFFLVLPQAFGQTYNINHDHLNELSEDSDAQFKPIEVKELELDEESVLDGIRKRFSVTYSKVNYSDVYATYNVSGDGESIYDLDSENLNTAFDENIELVKAGKISVEYMVTDNFSIEVADTYRHYQMNGRRVGRSEGGLFSDDEYTVYESKNETILNDIQVGARYAIRMVDTPRLKLDLSPGISGGLVHVNTRTKSFINNKEYQDDHFNDIGGYSYGVSLETKVTFYDRFFISAGVEYRNYVMAPIKHDSGFSQQIDQEGVNFYIGGGVRF